MNKKIMGLALGLVTMITVGFSVATAQASDTVKIGGVTVSRSYLNTNTYYQAKTAVKATLTYYKVSKPSVHTTGTITLPKGTVVSGLITPKHHLANGQWADELIFSYGGNLNYSLINAKAKKGYRGSGAVSYAVNSFKKIKAPAYMPTYSAGDLYLGGSKAAREDTSATMKQIVRVTTNGYIELHRISASDTDFSGKPVSQAKIEKTKVSGATRYLYLGSKLKGLKTTRVGKKGAYQYRLAMKNLHQPQNLSYYDDDRGEVYVFDSLYSLGGVTYYTPICFGSEIED